FPDWDPSHLASMVLGTSSLAVDTATCIHVRISHGAMHTSGFLPLAAEIRLAAKAHDKTVTAIPATTTARESHATYRTIGLQMRTPAAAPEGSSFPNFGSTAASAASFSTTDS